MPVVEGPLRLQRRRQGGAGRCRRENETYVQLEEESVGASGAGVYEATEAGCVCGRDCAGQHHHGFPRKRGPVDGCASQKSGSERARAPDCEEECKSQSQGQKSGLGTPGWGTVGHQMID